MKGMSPSVLAAMLVSLLGLTVSGQSPGPDYWRNNYNPVLQPQPQQPIYPRPMPLPYPPPPPYPTFPPPPPPTLPPPPASTYPPPPLPTYPPPLPPTHPLAPLPYYPPLAPLSYYPPPLPSTYIPRPPSVMCPPRNTPFCNGPSRNPCCPLTPTPTTPTCSPTTCPPPKPPMCCNYKCPPTPTPMACPYTSARGKRSAGHAQRRCYVNGHCPSDSSCCSNGCSNSKVCKRKIGGSSSNADYSYQPPKVNITVMFTSGCQDSLSFLRDQIYPFSQYLKQYINVELVAYGKVKQTGKCHFGYGDCLGNWMIACANRHLPTQEAALAFTVCLMTNRWYLIHGNYSSIGSSAVQCARGHPDKVNRLYYCGVGTEGFQLFQQAGARQYQLAPNLIAEPTVAMDGVVIIRRVAELVYFPGHVCEKLKNIPEARTLCQRMAAFQGQG